MAFPGHSMFLTVFREPLVWERLFIRILTMVALASEGNIIHLLYESSIMLHKKLTPKYTWKFRALHGSEHLVFTLDFYCFISIGLARQPWAAWHASRLTFLARSGFQDILEFVPGPKREGEGVILPETYSPHGWSESSKDKLSVLVMSCLPTSSAQSTLFTIRVIVMVRTWQFY